MRTLELKSGGNPRQSGGVFSHIVELGDLRGGVAEQIGDLSGRVTSDFPVRLLDPVEQIGGKGVTKGMQTFSLNPCCFQDPVESFSEIDRAGEAAMLIWDEGCILSEVVFLA